VPAHCTAAGVPARLVGPCVSSRPTPVLLDAPRRRVAPVEVGSTQRVVD
jgi:hypothetical protein